MATIATTGPPPILGHIAPPPRVYEDEAALVKGSMRLHLARQDKVASGAQQAWEQTSHIHAAVERIALNSCIDEPTAQLASASLEDNITPSSSSIATEPTELDNLFAVAPLPPHNPPPGHPHTLSPVFPLNTSPFLSSNNNATFPDRASSPPSPRSSNPSLASPSSSSSSPVLPPIPHIESIPTPLIPLAEEVEEEEEEERLSSQPNSPSLAPFATADGPAPPRQRQSSGSSQGGRSDGRRNSASSSIRSTTSHPWETTSPPPSALNSPTSVFPLRKAAFPTIQPVRRKSIKDSSSSSSRRSHHPQPPQSTASNSPPSSIMSSPHSASRVSLISNDTSSLHSSRPPLPINHINNRSTASSIYSTTSSRSEGPQSIFLNPNNKPRPITDLLPRFMKGSKKNAPPPTPAGLGPRPGSSAQVLTAALATSQTWSRPSRAPPTTRQYPITSEALQAAMANNNSNQSRRHSVAPSFATTASGSEYAGSEYGGRDDGPRGGGGGGQVFATKPGAFPVKPRVGQQKPATADVGLGIE